ncbi:hypothetical protein HJC23_001407 [Cyclotella cryptica]|uniref:Uncharacterized protein n=1 Tax=Cyclotella cryptica TaxID=29204 RepID=A0ABD3PD11_9STRA
MPICCCASKEQCTSAQGRKSRCQIQLSLHAEYMFQEVDSPVKQPKSHNCSCKKADRSFKSTIILCIIRSTFATLDAVNYAV